MEMSHIDRSFERGLKTLALDIWKFKLRFVLVSLIVFILLMLALLTIQPIYEASAVLIVGQETLDHSPDTIQNKVPETNISLARVAESEEVIRQAIGKVGRNNIYPNTAVNSVSTLFSGIHSFLFKPTQIGEHETVAVDLAVAKIIRAFSVKAEPLSNIIRISFRHRDPIIGARVVNAIAQAFIDRQIALSSKPGGAEFFRHQKQNFDDEFQAASKNLEEFEILTGTYPTIEQRSLVLKRYNDIALAASVTRSSIAEKLGQRQALITQIKKLDPVAGFSSLPTYFESLKEDTDKNKDDLDFNRNRANALSPSKQKNSNPPLLYSKVYQESLATLFVINSNLAGAENMQKQQDRELGSLKAELDRISSNEMEYTRLKQAVTRAALSSDVYAKRMVEEQMSADLTAAKLSSSVKIIQMATVPIKPVFPNYILGSILVCILSLVAGVTSLKVKPRFLGKIRELQAVRHRLSVG